MGEEAGGQLPSASIRTFSLSSEAIRSCCFFPCRAPTGNDRRRASVLLAPPEAVARAGVLEEAVPRHPAAGEHLAEGAPDQPH